MMWPRQTDTQKITTKVPLKKNLKLENEEKITTQHSTHKRNEENTTERKKLSKQRMDSDGSEKGQGGWGVVKRNLALE